MLPHREEKDSSAKQPEPATLDEKITEAIQIIQGGKEPPMKGIGLLREVLQEDPGNIRALNTLGVFSLVSGQAEKAEERFREILGLDSTQTEAWFYLGEAKLMQGDTASARSAYQDYLHRAPEGGSRAEAETRIASMEK